MVIMMEKTIRLSTTNDVLNLWHICNMAKAECKIGYMDMKNGWKNGDMLEDLCSFQFGKRLRIRVQGEDEFEIAKMIWSYVKI